MGKKTEEDIGHLFLMIKLQSEASSSIDFDEIKKEELIGEGAYGKVFRGFYRYGKFFLTLELKNSIEKTK